MVACADLALAIERERPALLRFARLQLRESMAAEDVVQETLLAALQARGQWRQTSSLRTWLIGILKHKVVDVLREQRKQENIVPTDPVDDWFDEHGHWRAEHAPTPVEWRDPESQLAKRQLMDAIERCIGRLPDASARAFTLRELYGLSTPEILAATGLREGHLHVLLFRARTALRACLEPHWR
jgi:RNA polymerase sigma-70 factor (ECF subfamily)